MNEPTNMVVAPDPNAVREEMLRIYPPKTRKKRAKQILSNDPEAPPEIAANTRTIPGIISQRGCTYAGCRGVVMGPIYDLLQITHGPVGCGFYAWMTRRNLARPKPGEVNYMQYCMNTDMQEDQIIFGGEKKLRQAIKEAYEIFHPKAIAILATCPVGLIGDDIHTIARQMKEELGINVMAFSCEGYKGVSQSAGHHIANNGVFKNIIGLDDTPDQAEFNMNILGEYNIGGDAWEIDTLLRKCGIHVTSTLSGDVSYDQVKKSHTVQLNGVMCHRSINYIADMMEKKFGIPWIKVNFIGAEAAKKTLRKIARFFDSAKLTDRVEEVILQEMLASNRCRTKSARDARARPRRCLSAARGRTTIRSCFATSAWKRFRPDTSSRTATITRAGACCRRSRWTPTAATSRNSMSNPIPRVSSPPGPRNKWRLWKRADSASAITRG
jgi:nitrogenase molybdenum-iron protein alpha chain